MVKTLEGVYESGLTVRSWISEDGWLFKQISNNLPAAKNYFSQWNELLNEWKEKS
jgi:hypothetical protein